MARLIGLNFHGIGTPARDLEEGEAPYWLSEAQFFDVLDRVADSSTPSTYCLTFDDGNLSDYKIALPALKQRGLTATFCVLTGRLDEPGSLTRDHVKALMSAGMGVGSHGIAHVAWNMLGSAALEQELTGSREVLQKLSGAAVTKAGIPFGRYNARVLRALRRTGYKTAFSSDAGYMSDTAFLRPRTSLRGDMTPAEIDAILAGRMPVSRRMRRTVSMVRKQLLPLG
ncbi:polysaccharide deacetylase family protein [Ruegeria atlantica]|uniref:polysaccharide deacetylase family protein n=1 Tax=Ruegeria atlantica TaxID=81569 RepID=UPI00147C6C01|nr:polysaccharide deacetylase family protein [Ruegeria atlantica]